MKSMRFIHLAMVTPMIVILTSSLFGSSFSQTPNSNLATVIFNNKTLTVPNNVKNFVILIPNEAHESPELPKDQRIINQPYVPQNLVVGPHTKIIWFVGDVGHTRKVTLTDENSNEIFNAVLHFNSASKPVSLNQTGKFTYSESNANKEDPNFVMKGSITVHGNNTESNIGENMNSQANYDSMGVLMVPTRDIAKQGDTIIENNLDVLGEYSFKDLRETVGGGANQTLLVLGSNDSINVLISVLKQITSSLPYS